MERLELSLEARDQSAGVVDSFNKRMAASEAAIDKVSRASQVNAQETGKLAAIYNATEAAIGKVVEKAEAGINAIGRLAKGTADLATEANRAKTEIAGLLGTLGSVTASFVAQEQAAIGITNTYRLLRLALSPTVFTAVTVAIGALVEKSVELAYSAGQIANAQILQAERLGITVRTYQALSGAASIAGTSSKSFISAATELNKVINDIDNHGRAAAALRELGVSLKNDGEFRTGVDLLREIGVRVENLKDPADRARIAFSLFGKEVAEEILPHLDSRIDNNISSLNEFGGVLGSIRTSEMAEFSKGVDDIGKAFDRANDSAKALFAGLKNKFAQAGAAVGNAGLSFLKDPILGPGLAFHTNEEIVGSVEANRIRRERLEKEQNGLSDAEFKAQLEAGLKRIEIPNADDTIDNKIAEVKKKIRETEFTKGASAQSGNDPEFQKFIASRIEGYKKELAALKEVQSNLSDIRPIEVIGNATDDKADAIAEKVKRGREALEKELEPLKALRAKLIAVRETKYGVDAEQSSEVEKVAAGQRLIQVQAEIEKRESQVKSIEQVEQAEKRTSTLLREAQSQELAGLAKIIAEYRAYQKELGISAKANRDLADAFQLRIQREAIGELRKNAKDALKEITDLAEKQNEIRTNKFKQGLDFQINTGDLALKNNASELDQSDAIKRSRDQQLTALDAINAQTLAQKLSVEAQKLKIEQDYINQSAVNQLQALDREQEYEVKLATDRADLLLRLGIINEEQRLDAINELNRSYGLKAQKIAEETEFGIQQARQKAATTANKEIVDATLRTYDQLKRGAEGIFDQVFTKGKNIFEQIGNVAKTALLTALKDVVTSNVAARLTTLVTGQKVTLQTDSNNAGPLGKVLGGLGVGARPIVGQPTLPPSKLEQPGHLGDAQLMTSGALKVFVENQAQGGQGGSESTALAAAGGGLLVAAGALSRAAQSSVAASEVVGSARIGDTASRLGGGLINRTGESIGGVPSFGGQSLSGLSGILGAPGGTAPTFGGSSGLGGILGSGGTSGGGFGGILGGGLGGLKDIFFNSGSISTGAGAANTAAGIGGFGGKLAGIGSSPAATLGGGLLIADGLRRGGVGGLVETTGGGALVGFKFGGPIGALIGGAAGLAAGLFGLGRKSSADKIIEKIKNFYGITVDKNFANQIASMAKSTFGDNIDVAIRSPQVRELLQLYAQSTGQNFSKTLAATPRPVELVQSGGQLTQAAQRIDGQAFAFQSSLPTYGGISTQTLPSAAPPAYTYQQDGKTYSIPGGGNPTTQGGDTYISIDKDSVASFFQGQGVKAIQNNPATVAQANVTALQSSQSRQTGRGVINEPLSTLR
jgi:hypothetical protein